MPFITFRVLSPVLKARTRFRAIKDARVGLYAVEDFIQALFGPRPTPFRPTEDERHRRLQHQRTNVAKAEELKNDLHEKEERHKHKVNPKAAWAAVGALFFIELVGSVEVFRRAGLEGLLVFATGSLITLTMFVFGYKCARQVLHTLAFYLWHIGFLGFGFVIAAIRYYQLVAREDASTGESLSMAAVLFAITVIPALFAEMCIRAALDGRETARDRDLTKRELKKEEAAIADAHKEVEKINDQAAGWDHLAGLIRAEYRRHWLYERRRLGDPAPELEAPREAS